MMVINEDIESFTFKPTIKDKITLYIGGRYKKYKSTLNKLYHLQQDKEISITRYRVSLDELNHLKFSRCFSNKSNIKKILITIHKNT